MEKLDMAKKLGDVYKAPRGGPVEVEVPPVRCLMIDGKGDPNGEAFRAAVEALYALSYALKFAVKRGPLATDYKVMPLEALWWADDMDAFVKEHRDEWFWTALITQPDLVDEALVEELRTEVARKKDLAGLERIRFETFDEGRCAQILHVGPYAEEAPTIEKLHAFIAELGLRPRGKHHEIYIGDPRKAAPDKLKTIIRQPMG